MKREPSAFSFIRPLDVGESAILPSEKAYSARCAASYMEAEYGYSYSVTASPDGTKVIITRTA